MLSCVVLFPHFTSSSNWFGFTKSSGHCKLESVKLALNRSSLFSCTKLIFNYAIIFLILFCSVRIESPGEGHLLVYVLK